MSFVASTVSQHDHDHNASSPILKAASSVDPDVADKAEQRSNTPEHIMMENEKCNKRATDAYSTTATTNSFSKISKKPRSNDVSGSPSPELPSLQQQVATLLSPSLFLFEEEDQNDDGKLQQLDSDSWQEELNEVDQFHSSNAVAEAVASLNPFVTVFQDDDHEETTKYPKNKTRRRQKTPTDQLFQLATLGSWSEFIEHCELYPQDSQWWTPLLPLFIQNDNHRTDNDKIGIKTSSKSSENKQQRQQQNYGTLLHYLLQLCHNGEGGGSDGEDNEAIMTQHSYHHTAVSLPTPPYSAFEVLVKAYPSAVVIQSSLWKRTPLHDAIDSNSVSRPIFRLLLETSNQYIPPTLVELQSILSLPSSSSMPPRQKQEESLPLVPLSSSRQSYVLPDLPLEIIRDYIYPYANIQPLEIQDWEDNTPLHLFFKKSRETYGSQKLVRDLIDECPQALRLTNNEGKTPIIQAILSNASPYQFEMLIDAYPQVLLQSLPLSVTTSTTSSPEKVASLLQTNNNGHDGKHERGATPLHYYLQHRIIQGKNYSSSTSGETLHTVRLLAGTCPEVLTMKDRDDKTPLQLLQDYNEFNGFAMNLNHRHRHANAFEDRDEGIIQDCIQLLERLLLENAPNYHL